jgi:hypothetical protein
MPLRRGPHALHRSSASPRGPHPGAPPPADAESPHVRELLESLDDAVFAALGGSEPALAKTRELWPALAAALGPELLDESREQYLRYAIELTRRFEFKEIRDPTIAVAALEIIELLTRH